MQCISKLPWQKLVSKTSTERGRATMRYCMFNMLTIGALYTHLSRKLFIGLGNSLVHCEANIDRFPMNPRIFKSDE